MFIDNITANGIVNKSVLVGIPIAIMMILLGMYFVSSDTEITNELNSEIDSQNDNYVPKSYKESLSETVSVTVP